MIALRAQIRIKILKALRACHGVPLPDDSICGAVLPFVPGAGPSDVMAELTDLETQIFVVGETDLITGLRSFNLTTKGALAAKQL